jgi:hypothetical protein
MTEAPRPPTGSRWLMPVGSRWQPVEVMPPQEDNYEMVAVLTTRSHTVRDSMNYPVRKQAGTKSLVPAANFARLTRCCDETTGFHSDPHMACLLR